VRASLFPVASHAGRISPRTECRPCDRRHRPDSDR